MEKDIDRISKNPDIDIVIRIDDYGGKKGLTVREFIRGERYTGFTKNGTRIPAEKFKQFKAAINSIDEKDIEEIATTEVEQEMQEDIKTKKNSKQKSIEEETF